jgi:hypothetical protein
VYTADRVVVGTGIALLAVIAGAAAYLGITYSSLYDGREVAGVVRENLSESYRGALSIVGSALAVIIPFWAAFTGRRLQSVRAGLVALAAGMGAMVVALSLVPWVYFPSDQYAASWLWLIDYGLIVLLIWTGATVLVQRAPRKLVSS